MSERKETPDLMKEVLAGKKSKAARPGAEIEDTGNKKLMSLRLPASWKKELQAHFADKGLDLSSGLRLWIGERMEEEGLK